MQRAEHAAVGVPDLDRELVGQRPEVELEVVQGGQRQPQQHALPGCDGAERDADVCRDGQRAGERAQRELQAAGLRRLRVDIERVVPGRQIDQPVGAAAQAAAAVVIAAQHTRGQRRAQLVEACVKDVVAVAVAQRPARATEGRAGADHPQARLGHVEAEMADLIAERQAGLQRLRRADRAQTLAQVGHMGLAAELEVQLDGTVAVVQAAVDGQREAPAALGREALLRIRCRIALEHQAAVLVVDREMVAGTGLYQAVELVVGASVQVQREQREVLRGVEAAAHFGTDRHRLRLCTAVQLERKVELALIEVQREVAGRNPRRDRRPAVRLALGVVDRLVARRPAAGFVAARTGQAVAAARRSVGPLHEEQAALRRREGVAGRLLRGTDDIDLGPHLDHLPRRRHRLLRRHTRQREARYIRRAAGGARDAQIKRATGRRLREADVAAVAAAEGDTAEGVVGLHDVIAAVDVECDREGIDRCGGAAEPDGLAKGQIGQRRRRAGDQFGNT